jgi:hypothetical protein
MVLSEKALRRLFPPGHAFKLPGEIGLVITALSLSFERLRAFFKTITTEAIPFYAVLTLPAWYQALGMTYDPTRTLGDLQAQADAAWANTGGQYLNYLNAQIQKELPNVYLSETLSQTQPTGWPGMDGRCNVGRSGLATCSGFDVWMTYQVNGTVTDRTHYNRLQAILARIAPLHLQPMYNVQIMSEQFIARSGIAQTNNARSGKGS